MYIDLSVGIILQDVQAPTSAADLLLASMEGALTAGSMRIPALLLNDQSQEATSSTQNAKQDGYDEVLNSL